MEPLVGVSVHSKKMKEIIDGWPIGEAHSIHARAELAKLIANVQQRLPPPLPLKQKKPKNPDVVSTVIAGTSRGVLEKPEPVAAKVSQPVAAEERMVRTGPIIECWKVLLGSDFDYTKEFHFKDIELELVVNFTNNLLNRRDDDEFKIRIDQIKLAFEESKNEEEKETIYERLYKNVVKFFKDVKEYDQYARQRGVSHETDSDDRTVEKSTFLRKQDLACFRILKSGDMKALTKMQEFETNTRRQKMIRGEIDDTKYILKSSDVQVIMRGYSTENEDKQNQEYWKCIRKLAYTIKSFDKGTTMLKENMAPYYLFYDDEHIKETYKQLIQRLHKACKNGDHEVKNRYSLSYKASFDKTATKTFKSWALNKLANFVTTRKKIKSQPQCQSPTAESLAVG
eukprot:GHVH01010120.1.p1 GENE.GHVH01010120.1~~GHVH01010120.1.p1  ORF type:complete len:408 (-),score=47.74 GHVH01010120.1:28-1218(-)